jgi:hypothetical protein
MTPWPSVSVARALRAAGGKEAKIKVNFESAVEALCGRNPNPIADILARDELVSPTACGRAPRSRLPFEPLLLRACHCRIASSDAASFPKSRS